MILYWRWFSYEDYGTLKMFYERRNLPCPPFCDLPEVGVIVEGCAALFLYRTDGGVALIDGVITDPKAPEHIRRNALRQGIATLTHKAKRFGAKKVLGFTQVPSMVEMAKQMGYEEADKPYVLMHFDLSTLKRHEE